MFYQINLQHNWHFKISLPWTRDCCCSLRTRQACCGCCVFSRHCAASGGSAQPAATRWRCSSAPSRTRVRRAAPARRSGSPSSPGSAPPSPCTDRWVASNSAPSALRQRKERKIRSLAELHWSGANSPNNGEYIRVHSRHKKINVLHGM